MFLVLIRSFKLTKDQAFMYLSIAWGLNPRLLSFGIITPFILSAIKIWKPFHFFCWWLRQLRQVQLPHKPPSKKEIAKAERGIYTLSVSFLYMVAELVVATE